MYFFDTSCHPSANRTYSGKCVSLDFVYSGNFGDTCIDSITTPVEITAAVILIGFWDVKVNLKTVSCESKIQLLLHLGTSSSYLHRRHVYFSLHG